MLPHLAGARVVAAYHPLKDEISPAAILAGLGEGQRFALPWFADRDAQFLWREGPASEPSPWGVLQPPADAAALAPDIVLVPIVLADRNGTRIGHGKGHYDRALAHLREAGPVTTIGLAWESQVCEAPHSRRPLGRQAGRGRDAEGVDPMRLEPTWRQPFGIALIVLWIIGWCVAVASVGAMIVEAPWWAQTPYYVTAGLVWVLPLKPLLRWMETGRWRG